MLGWQQSDDLGIWGRALRHCGSCVRLTIVKMD